jgi:diguanylate cyclase
MQRATPLAPEPRHQALRLKRFLLATITYALGYGILVLCSAVGLLPVARLAGVGAAFVAVNLAWFVVFRSGWNQRFADPSLTQAQVVVGASAVVLILLQSAHIHFVAVPFYSSIFVFAMLKLKPSELVIVEAYVLVTYAVAIALRLSWFAGELDLRLEAIYAALVVLSSVWYAMAASYISGLRARLRESVQTIEQLASRDALTGIWNRRHLDSLLHAELQRQQRFGGALSLCLVDVDHFKSINDRFGHLAGDAVLKRVAESMDTTLRNVDSLGRFGGEEFLAVLPGTAQADAAICAERLRVGVAALQGLTPGDSRVTVSIGVAEAQPGEVLADLLARVDAAMYQAKREGRDRVVLAAPARVSR